VRDGVVHLAGDAGAFGRPGPLDLRGLLAFEPFGALGEAGDHLPAGVDPQADREREADQEQHQEYPLPEGDRSLWSEEVVRVEEIVQRGYHQEDAGRGGGEQHHPAAAAQRGGRVVRRDDERRPPGEQQRTRRGDRQQRPEAVAGHPGGDPGGGGEQDDRDVASGQLPAGRVVEQDEHRQQQAEHPGRGAVGYPGDPPGLVHAASL
jgi:hypothetical protein